MTDFTAIPIGKIVAENLATAAVFEQYNMDYCCHGHQTLAEACQSHGVELAQVQAELTEISESPRPGLPNAKAMSLDELCRYIVAVHHTFTKQILPSIASHFATVVKVHGDNHPELNDLQAQFTPLREELDGHLLKEENVLFPYIEQLAQASREHQTLPKACFSTVSQPISTMLQEHETAGAILDQMHADTNGFQPPADACNTYRLLFKQLSELEQDLHRHIALENYLLFPDAIKLEKKCRTPDSN